MASDIQGDAGSVEKPPVDLRPPAIGPKSVSRFDPGTVEVRVGAFIVMRDERWFVCDDVNIELHRHATKLGVALAAFWYQDGDGGKPPEVATFTLRQFYQDRDKPSLDYTDQALALWLEGIERYQGLARRRAIETALTPSRKRFEKDYTNFEAERDALMGVLA